MGGRGTARRGNLLPEVIQEGSNKGRNISDLGSNPGVPKLVPRKVNGRATANCRKQKHPNIATELISIFDNTIPFSGRGYGSVVCF